VATARTTAGPGQGWSQSSSGKDKNTGPAGGCTAVAIARMNAAGTSWARAGSYAHLTHGRGSIVASTLVSHGSSSSIWRVCCPAVTISGVLFWNAVSRLPIAFPSPAPVCRLTSAGRRVACA